MKLDGRQIKLAGEILGSDVEDPASESSVTLSGSFASLPLSISFRSDRSGSVLVELAIFLDKTTSGEVAGVEFRLSDGSDPVPGTTRTAIEFHSSNGSTMAVCAWVLSVTDATDYTVEVEARRSSGSSSTIVARYGGARPAATFRVVGL
jgi:hypothetical protein